MKAASPLAPGLYLVATPIGNARDITLRALDLLAAAEVLAAEDTRSARRLMELHGVALGSRPLIAYHDHNGPAVRPRLMRLLAEGRTLAYLSDAGTPLVADPGYRLVHEAVAAGHEVFAVPGASSVLTALAVAGLPTDRFHFAGFPPPAAGPRAAFLRELAPVAATLVLFESPKRAARTLAEMVEALGADRRAALCRELTKLHEEVRRGTLAELAASAAADPPRGEVVLLVDRPHGVTGGEDLGTALDAALRTMSVRDAVDAVAATTGLPRRDVYKAALSRAPR